MSAPEAKPSSDPRPLDLSDGFDPFDGGVAAEFDYPAPPGWRPLRPPKDPERPVIEASFDVLLSSLAHAHDKEVGHLRRELKKARHQLNDVRKAVGALGDAGGRSENSANFRSEGSALKVQFDEPSPRPSPRKASLNSSGKISKASEPSVPGIGDSADSTDPLDGSVPAPGGAGDGVLGIVSTSSSQFNHHEALKHQHPHSFMKRGLSQANMNTKHLAHLRLQQNQLHRLVLHPSFEITFSAFILLNGVMMAVEAQYRGFDLAQETEHFSALRTSKETWPYAENVFLVSGWVFGVLFCLEIILKIAGLRWAFVKDCWNWLDCIIVMFWVFSVVLDAIMPVNAFILRLARLARLMRLWRLVKTMRRQQFDSLYLMTTALKGSIPILGWAIILMLVIHLLPALVFAQGLREFYFDNSTSDSLPPGTDPALVYQYFGSFSRALLTMFEITLANWPVACRVLTENISEWFIVYTLMHKMILGFAVIGVVNAVFIQETFKVATLDDTVMVRQTVRKQKFHHDKMRRLFEEADHDMDGRINVHEWQQVCKDDWVKVWLASQDLHPHDTKLLFELMDREGKEYLTLQDLIHGASELKGAATNMDMKVIMRDLMERLPKQESSDGASSQQPTV